MRSNYKRLGPYIRLIDIRNKSLEVELLLGVSVQKVFIPSIANTVGTDFSKYKIVRHKQFTYIADTSRRGDKIGLAMLEEYEEALVSSAYTVFEVINHEELDPEYLMMWFRRPEFDRYARFKSHGSVREIFDWEEMCEVELPIPSIEKQREIVKEYNTVVNRIKLNEQLNQKLEETAQALYKHWFVDFEFPNEEGKPYKSSGGKMVWNEELGREIPEGWNSTKLKDVVTTQYGFTASASFEAVGPKFLRITDIASEYIDWSTVPNCQITNSELEKYKLYYGDVLVARTGATAGYAQQINRKIPEAVFASYLVRLKAKHIYLLNYLGLIIVSNFYKDYIKEMAGGSAQPQANASLMTDLIIVLPERSILEAFNNFVADIRRRKEFVQIGNSKLTGLRNILLSKLAQVEVEEKEVVE